MDSQAQISLNRLKIVNGLKKSNLLFFFVKIVVLNLQNGWENVHNVMRNTFVEEIIHKEDAQSRKGFSKSKVSTPTYK